MKEILFILVSFAFGHGGDGHDHPSYDTAVGSGTPSSGSSPVISVGRSEPAPAAPAEPPPTQAPPLSAAPTTSDPLIIPPARGAANLEKGTGATRTPASTKKLSDVLRKAAEDRRAREPR